MKNVLIYLAGGMGNLSFDEYTKWRNQVKNAILYGDYDYCYTPLFIDPTIYYNFEIKSHKTEREVFEFDLSKVKESDLIVVNFNEPSSLGTAMELAVAKDHGINIVGINSNGYELHPWLVECCTRMCDNMKEAVEHIVNFYLK